MADTEYSTIMNTFKTFIQQKADYANAQIGQVNDIFKKLLNININLSNELNTNITTENKTLDKQITINNSLINRSGLVKWKYQEKEIDNLKYQNNILFIVFYVLLLILTAFMFYYNTVSFRMRLVILFLLLTYPFIIYYFELFGYIILSYLYSYFYNIPYEKVYIGSG